MLTGTREALRVTAVVDDAPRFQIGDKVHFVLPATPAALFAPSIALEALPCLSSVFTPVRWQSVWQHLRTAGMWLFPGTLIVLGTIDALTNGRSRNWPFRDR